MAIYYKLSLTEEEEIFQNDKSEDKKFFSNAKIKGLIEQDGASATDSSYLLLAYPLNSSSVVLKSIVINKVITPISSTGIYIHNAKNIGIPIPYHRLKILVGLSDQPVNVHAIDITSYQKQNYISVPCYFGSNQESFELPAINERFFLTKNQTYLNIFIFFYVLETGDVTTFYTDANGIYAAKGGLLTIENYLFDLSVVVNGKAV